MYEGISSSSLSVADAIIALFSVSQNSDQELSAPGQTGHHRADGNIGDLRDIAIVQLIDFPQHDDFTKLGRHLCQGSLNIFGIRLEKSDLFGGLYPLSVQAFMLKFLL